MRIISGTARSVPLATIESEETRPTGDRVKEAMFSMLQFQIEGRRVLDLFAGSGQLGLEALSRGALQATFIDQNRECVDVVIANAKKAKLFDKCRISTGDFRSYLKGAAGREKYDIIFLDPPYKLGLIPEALMLIDTGELLNDGGIIACECEGKPAPKSTKRPVAVKSDRELVEEELFDSDSSFFEIYSVKRTALYSKTRLTLLCKKSDSEDEQ